MKFSARARYGIRFLLYLGGSGEARVGNIPEFARRENLSARFLSQILIQLKAGGLVKAVRGPKGGYLLARPSREIPVLDILKVLDDDFSEPADLPEDGILVCLWNEIQASMKEKLARLTLRDLAEWRLRNGAGYSYDI